MRTTYARAPPFSKNDATAYGRRPGPSNRPKSRVYSFQLSTGTATDRVPVAPSAHGRGAHGAPNTGIRDGPRGATPTNAHTSIRSPVSERRGVGGSHSKPGAPSGGSRMPTAVTYLY